MYRTATSRAANTQRALQRATAVNDAALLVQSAAAVAACIAPATPNLTINVPPPLVIDRALLISTFSAGLYSVPLHLRDPLRIISKHILDQAVSDNDNAAANGVGAFQLLPGLIQYSSHFKSAVLSST